MGGQNGFLKGKKERKRGFGMCIFWNEETRLDIDYEFKNVLMKVSRGFCCQQLQIQAQVG